MLSSKQADAANAMKVDGYISLPNSLGLILSVLQVEGLVYDSQKGVVGGGGGE